MNILESREADLEIPTQTVNQRAYERLCDLILSGRVRFGERLDERVLAERMKISRTPIRDAIGRLATEGLVERRPYQGNYVRSFTHEQINDLYVVRLELEVLAVRLALPRASSEEIRNLEYVVKTCHDAYARGDLVAFERQDQAFHECIARMSGNATLLTCLENLRLQVQLARHYANQDPDMAAQSIEERNAIVKAFQERDVNTAVRMIKQHIQAAQQAFSTQVRSGLPTNAA